MIRGGGFWLTRKLYTICVVVVFKPGIDRFKMLFSGGFLTVVEEDCKFR